MKYLLFVTLILIVACSEELIHNTELNYNISIDGYVSTQEDYVSVFLHKPKVIDDGSAFKTITDAEVRLIGNDTIYSFGLDTDSWCFISDKKIRGVAGNAYTLEVHYAGRIFTSTDTMPQPPNDDYYLPFYETEESSYPVCYEHNFGYTKTNIWNFDWYLSANFNSVFRESSISYTHLGNIPQGVFAHTFSTFGKSFNDDHLWLYKAEISQQYEKYLRAKYNETYWQGNMFSTQPANIPSNCSEGAVGFFYTLNIAYKRLHKDEIMIIEE